LLARNGAGLTHRFDGGEARGGLVRTGEREGQTPKPIQLQTQDRAAVVTTAVVQVLGNVLLDWWHRDGTDWAAARAEIEAILRDEFHAIARTTRDEIRLTD